MDINGRFLAISKFQPPQITRQMFKYACVGACGFVIHLGSTAFLVEVVSLPYWIAFCGGLPFTYITKFLLDKYWTFGR